MSEQVEPRFKAPKQPKDISAKTRALIRERSGGMCEMRVKGVCSGAMVQIDHIKNRSQGRDHSPSNLNACCLNCHDWKGKNLALAHSLGLYRHEWE